MYKADVDEAGCFRTPLIVMILPALVAWRSAWRLGIENMPEPRRYLKQLALITLSPSCPHVERLRLHISRTRGARGLPFVVLGPKAVQERPTVSTRSKAISPHREPP